MRRIPNICVDAYAVTKTACPEQGFFSRTIFPKSRRKPEMPLPSEKLLYRPKKFGQFEFEHRSRSNKEGMRLQSYSSVWRGGSDVNLVLIGAWSWVRSPLSDEVFVHFFRFLMQKYVTVLAVWFVPATSGLFRASYYHCVAKNVLSNCGRILFVWAQNILNSNFVWKISFEKTPRFTRFRGNRIFRCPPIKKCYREKKSCVQLPCV
jgi:hypothetical protein